MQPPEIFSRTISTFQEKMSRREDVEMQLKFISAILFSITVRSCLIRFSVSTEFNKSLAAIKNVKTLRTIIA
jgi:hypothetical protein